MTVEAQYDPRLRAFFDSLREDTRREIVVGVLGAKAKAEHDGEIGTNPKVRPTVVDVATWHEFGTPRIPQRSFLRDGLRAAKPKILDQAAKELRAYMLGKRTAAAAWERIGLVAVGEIQQRMANGIAPALKVRAGTPLIDTGQLRSSITFEVRG